MSGKSIHKIVVVGSGNLAFHLAETFYKAGKDIVAIVARNELAGQELAKLTGAAYLPSLEKCPADVDLIVLAVSDTAISTLADGLSLNEAIVVHISGSTPIEVFRHHKNYGVFYPLQSFSKGKAVRFKDIPVLIEGNSAEVSDALIQLGKEISNTVHQASTKDRRYLHLAAVFAANFSNALYAVADEIMKENTSLPFDILHPLIQETALKLTQLSPKDAQTGPARRNDTAIMSAQLELLQNKPELQDIYRNLSAQIQKNYHA